MAGAAALALLIGGLPASAQPAQTASLALGGCPAAPATPLGPQPLRDCFYQASLRASRAAQHVIAFETGRDVNAQTAAAFANAVTQASDVLVRMASPPGDKSALARITNVVITEGAKPSVGLSNGVLTVVIVPTDGAAGVPSSDQIETAVRAP